MVFSKQRKMFDKLNIIDLINKDTELEIIPRFFIPILILRSTSEIK